MYNATAQSSAVSPHTHIENDSEKSLSLNKLQRRPIQLSQDLEAQRRKSATPENQITGSSVIAKVKSQENRVFFLNSDEQAKNNAEQQ